VVEGERSQLVAVRTGCAVDIEDSLARSGGTSVGLEG